MPTADANLSVVIPTRDRLASLRQTLAALAQHDARARVEVTIIESGPSTGLSAASLGQDGLHAIRVLHEPAPGKAAALNRALREGGLASLIAVLDDDMEPGPNWASLVVASSAARPEFDIFSGRTHVVWPDGVQRPAWSSDSFAQSLQLSALDLGPGEDREMGRGSIGYASGNHFWFRRQVLDTVPEFPDVWPPELDFVLHARHAGHRGVFVADVRCGHRVQPELFDTKAFYLRARRFGAALERVERIGGGTKRRSRLRATAALARGAFRAARCWLSGRVAAFRPARRGVPQRAWAELSIVRQQGVMRRALRDMFRRPSSPPGAR